MTISAVSTAIFFAVAIAVIVTSPGWPAVREAFFDPAAVQRVMPALLRGFRLTIWLFMTAEPVILLVAGLLAILRGLRAPDLHAAADRGDRLHRHRARYPDDPARGALRLSASRRCHLQGVTNSRLFWAWVALVVSYSAYVAEVIRAGLESVHPSQRAAARSLGLSQWQSLRSRDSAASGASGDPTAAQRLHRLAEGHRAGVLRRRHRACSWPPRSTWVTPSTSLRW